MSDRSLPTGLVAARRSPVFDPASLPPPMIRSHRTAVWAELRVQAGSVRFIDLEGTSPRDEHLESGDCAVIAPGVGHRVEPSDGAVFYLQFYREPEAPVNPNTEADGSSHLTGM